VVREGVVSGTATKQMRETIQDGIVEFTPPWLGDVLLEIVGRLEAIEGRALEDRTTESLVWNLRQEADHIRSQGWENRAQRIDAAANALEARLP
jgi:hypothetical protein